MNTQKIADWPTGTEARVCDLIAQRQSLGLNKYGTTVAENPLSLRAWCTHALEEALDLAIYLQRTIEQLDRQDVNEEHRLVRKVLLDRYYYDQDTGVFTRKKNLPGGSRAGTVAGSTAKNVRKPYLSIRINKKLYLCHRLAWLYVHGDFPKGHIDHINGDGLDNRMCNLRQVTNEQNIQASRILPKHNTSGFRGVSWSKKDKRWIAGISIGDKRKYLGSFKTAEEAQACYLAAKDKEHFK